MSDDVYIVRPHPPSLREQSSNLGSYLLLLIHFNNAHDKYLPTTERGINGVCVLWSVTEQSRKTGTKVRKVRSVDQRAEQRGEKGVSLVEDDGLDTGEELHINALSQLTKETQTNNLSVT